MLVMFPDNSTRIAQPLSAIHGRITQQQPSPAVDPDCWLRSPTSKPPSSVRNHHQPSLTIGIPYLSTIKPSLTTISAMINHYKPMVFIKHHQPSSTFVNIRQPQETPWLIPMIQHHRPASTIS